MGSRRWIWVAAALSACGGDMQPTAKAPEGGATAAYASVGGMGGDVADSGGAGGSADPRQTGDDRGGTGGMAALQPPTGGVVAGNTGEEVRPVPQPQAGSGGIPKPEIGGGGAPAMQPVERVLWSQTWTVALHGTEAHSMTEGDQMGLVLSYGSECVIGKEPGPSGQVKNFQLGSCSTADIGGAVGNVHIFSGQKSIGGFGGADLSGWTAAVTGHTVLYLRRTQAYELWLLDNGDWTYDYADFTGTWEAVGY